MADLLNYVMPWETAETKECNIQIGCMATPRSIIDSNLRVNWTKVRLE